MKKYTVELDDSQITVVWAAICQNIIYLKEKNDEEWAKTTIKLLRSSLKNLGQAIDDKEIS
jgi:hypothetical protein